MTMMQQNGELRPRSGGAVGVFGWGRNETWRQRERQLCENGIKTRISQ